MAVTATAGRETVVADLVTATAVAIMPLWGS